MEISSSQKNLTEKLKEMKDWHRSIIFDDNGSVIAFNNCNIEEEEKLFYINSYISREKTIGEGFHLNNVHFDVHRFHPPLIYGRRGGPDDGEGIALCRLTPNEAKGGTRHWFLLITYLLPILSAKAVPQMVEFAQIYCGKPE